MKTADPGGVAPEWHLLKRTVSPPKVITDLSDATSSRSPGRIRCPGCDWEPPSSSRWICVSSDGPEPPFQSCGRAWNTFATRGLCPGCGHQWQWTMCLVCNEWALHEDWYEAGTASGGG